MNYCKTNDNTKSISSFFQYVYICRFPNSQGYTMSLCLKNKWTPNQERKEAWLDSAAAQSAEHLYFVTSLVAGQNTWQKATQIGKVCVNSGS